MKEIVDRIFKGEVVDIIGDSADFHFLVAKSSDKFIIAAAKKDNFNRCFDYSSQRVSQEEIKELGEKLIALHDELANRKRFKNGDDLYSVDPKGNIIYFYFNGEYANHLGLVMSGNAFKTREEASDNIPAVMAKYQDLRDRGLV